MVYFFHTLHFKFIPNHAIGAIEMSELYALAGFIDSI